MLNFDYLRIPRDDSDFEEEPEDELASAGFRVVDAEDAEEDEAEESVEKELETEAVVEEAEDEDEKDGPVDGLEELEELEKGVAAIPIGYDQDED